MPNGSVHDLLYGKFVDLFPHFTIKNLFCSATCKLDPVVNLMIFVL